MANVKKTNQDDVRNIQMKIYVSRNELKKHGNGNEDKGRKTLSLGFRELRDKQLK